MPKQITGGVYKRGSVWYYDFMIRGTRYRSAIPEARTKTQALEAKAKAQQAAFDDAWKSKRYTIPTLAEFTEKHFLPWSKQHKRSHNSDRYRCKTLNREFGALRLNEIRPMRIEQFKRRLIEAGKAPTTINQFLILLGQILRQAADMELITANPCQRVRKLALPPGRSRFLSHEERRRLFDALKTHADNEDQSDAAQRNFAALALAVEIALLTGMRRGEIYGLTWEQISIERQSLTLTKTKNGRARTIPMSSRLLEILSSRRTDDATGPILAGQFHDRHWRKVVITAELDNFHFHDLRHTAATYMGENGADAFTIAAILGHSDIRMTSRYTHATINRLKETAENLCRTFATNDGGKTVLEFRKTKTG